MKNLLIVSALFSMFVIAGCSHTNQLAKYEMTSKTCLFEDFVAPDAKEVNINFSSPLKRGSDAGAIIGLIADISSEIISADARIKLRKAVDASSIVYNVSQGIESTLTKYLNVKSVESQADEPEYFVETTLQKCTLGSSENGVGILVEARSRIIDRKTAIVIWEYSGDNVFPIKYMPYSTNRAVGSVQSVISAVQLSELTEEEIQKCVYEAAQGVGGLIAEVLREDIAESRGAK